ncbi:GrpB family protein [Halioglobus sp. HI00S01]|uniref:GrpB family protein n=1 Tax=Halioglobus sp. HI00S01 TaxID=1822214 RepID=UPI0018D2DBDE|nr:GrpB family protein [Halioglobus sp. HI00S01]
MSSDKEIDLACQVVILGSQYDVFRGFRDRLNNDIALVQAYNALKLKHFDLPYEQYRDAKAAFIERVLS